MICPRCRSAYCYRSHRRSVEDFVATLAGLRPWRCRTCEWRFYAWRVPLRFSAYAHCRRCGSFELQRAGAERVEKSFRSNLKRRLRFPAYRCQTCREKFFTMLPQRNIRASIAAPSRAYFDNPADTTNRPANQTG